MPITWSFKNAPLDLAFKAARDYLHSTDIFPALVDLVHLQCGSQAQVESLTIRRPIRYAILASSEPSATDVGSFRVRHGAEVVTGGLREMGQPITRRNSIDLPSVADTALSGPGFARLLKPMQGCVALELVVSLMKLVVAQSNPGHWWLCQIHFDIPLSAVFPLEVRMSRQIGNRFGVFDIVQANSYIGSARVILDNST